jgi:hypothetical protein
MAKESLLFLKIKGNREMEERRKRGGRRESMT